LRVEEKRLWPTGYIRWDRTYEPATDYPLDAQEGQPEDPEGDDDDEDMPDIVGLLEDNNLESEVVDDGLVDEDSSDSDLDNEVQASFERSLKEPFTFSGNHLIHRMRTEISKKSGISTSAALPTLSIAPDVLWDIPLTPQSSVHR
jgi:hypothetical protein